MGRLIETDPFEVYSKWKNGLDAFKCFFRAANFVSLKHYPDFILSEVPDNGSKYFEEIRTELKNYNFKDTLFIVDINGTDAIRTAFFIRKELLLAPVLVFNGVLHPYGLIGDKTYISYLIGYGLLNKEINSKGYTLVLDNNRYDDYSDDDLKCNFNNQYELGEEDLPSIEMLIQLGYKNLVYFYDKDIKEDLACYLEYLTQNGINVDKIMLTGDRN